VDVPRSYVRNISVFSLVLLTVCASTVLASAQATSSTTEIRSNSTTPGFVYVTSVNNNNTEEIYAYSESGDGALTPVAGSPFAANGYYLATNSKWLVSTDTVNIYSFSVAESGAITQVSSINAQQYNEYDTGGPVSLFFDRTGRPCTMKTSTAIRDEHTYQFFDLNQSTGALSFLGATTSYSAAWITPLSFIANNEYAYGASPCMEANTSTASAARQRNADGPQHQSVLSKSVRRCLRSLSGSSGHSEPPCHYAYADNDMTQTGPTKSASTRPAAPAT